jgi:hypothetical protein
MRFIVFVKASKESETGAMPEKKDLADMQRFNQELVNAGMMLAGEGLHATKEGKRIAFGGSTPKVSDGPFAEPQTLVAGYWVLKANSIDEVVDWMKKAPFKEGELEIRQIAEDEEFAFAPEIMQKEKQLRAQIAKQNQPS